MTNSPSPDFDYPVTITADDMNQLIAGGRAEPWTRELHGDTPRAALLDGTWESTELSTATLTAGTWYVVYGDSDQYRQARPDLAEILTRDAARLRAAAQSVADVDARNGT